MHKTALSLITLSLVWSASASANIFGDDKRQDASFSDKAPTNYQIVKIHSHFSGNATGYCTGILIGKSTVLTARHCVRRTIEVGPEKTIQYEEVRTGEIYVGWSNATNAKTNKKVVSYKDWSPIATVQYKDDYHSDTDFAFIYLEKPLGKKWGYFSVAEATGLSPESSIDVKNFGYPGDLNDRFTSQSCKLYSVDQTAGQFLLPTDCSMASGASGSPMIQCQEEGKCNVVGIFVYAKHSPNWSTSNPDFELANEKFESFDANYPNYVVSVEALKKYLSFVD